ncbi:MFS transporter [Streptomyces sp. NPDC057445]|uniref:MFS transporter n=1 Tax=Streptomyces sp. NPDC057445 TaxID=3346136 RepID=UPI0036CFC447
MVGIKVLADRNAGLYLFGVVASGFGTTAMWLVSGIWVKSLTGSDSLAALTVFAMWAPVLAGPLLGTVADRVRRRPLLIAVNVTMALLLPSLLLLDSADRLWLLFCVLAVYGAGGVLQEAAEAALVAASVDRRLLADLSGLRMTASEGMKLIAPLVAAGLFARFGGAAVALLDAATFAMAAGVFALMRVREVREQAPVRDAPGLRARTSAGVRFVWGSPVLRQLVAAGGATMLLAGLNGAALYAVADDVLGHPPAFAGMLYAAQGAGSVLVGLVAGPLLRRLPHRVFAAAGIALFSVAVALRSLPYDAVALSASGAIGLGLPCVLIAAMTAVQRETPDAVLGRAAASANTLLFAPNAVALALGAGLVAVVDVRTLLPVVGALGVAVAVWLTAVGRARERRDRRGRPAARLTEMRNPGADRAPWRET